MMLVLKQLQELLKKIKAMGNSFDQLKLKSDAQLFKHFTADGLPQDSSLVQELDSCHTLMMAFYNHTNWKTNTELMK